MINHRATQAAKHRDEKPRFKGQLSGLYTGSAICSWVKSGEYLQCHSLLICKVGKRAPTYWITKRVKRIPAVPGCLWSPLHVITGATVIYCCRPSLSDTWAEQLRSPFYSLSFGVSFLIGLCARRAKEGKETKILHFSMLELIRVPHPKRFAEVSSIKIKCSHTCLFWDKDSKLVFQQAFQELHNGDTVADK